MHNREKNRKIVTAMSVTPGGQPLNIRALRLQASALVSDQPLQAAGQSMRRQAHANPASTGCHATESCCHTSAQNFSPLATSQVVESGLQTEIRIMQMDCPVEETLIRKKLSTLAGVKGMDFNLMQRVLTVTHQPDVLPAIVAAIQSLGFTPQLAGEPDAAATADKSDSGWLLGFSACAGMAAEISHWMGAAEWLTAALALVAILTCGITTYKKGWIAIRNANFNINALMSIAVTGALALGQWPEAAMVMVLFTLAERIEAKSLDRVRNAIGSLMRLAPDTARVQQADGSWQLQEAQTITPGARVKVAPGERIALDGEIIIGETTVDQAPITGESLPVDKRPGDSVYAGTINQTGAITLRVTVAASNSTLARIIKAVEQAQGAKAATQRWVDKFARIYTPAVMVLALAVAILPPLAGMGSWPDWIYKALVMLVIACPCALVISTPVTLVSGLTAAARHGILIKGGVYLEQGRLLTTLALDKTGTLTHGTPVLTDLQSWQSLDNTALLALAASLASHSRHPVSQAIASAASAGTTRPVEAFTERAGYGVSGVIDNVVYRLGNLRMTQEERACPPEVQRIVDALEREGKTVVLLSDPQHILGVLAVADTVKETSREAIGQLHKLGIKTVMLTGDNPHTAAAIASQVGIDKVIGGLLPQDKQQAIETEVQRGVTGMVGDGINDAPALATANIGFAMGAMGTDTAIETADVALMDDDLRKIPVFIRLSRQTRQRLAENIVLALTIKALFLAFTLMGLGTMWMAVFADVGASLLVVANGLRLLRQ